MLIVDDSLPTRHRLNGILGNSQQFNVVGEAIDGRDTVDQARFLQPDLVVPDPAITDGGS